MKKYSVLIILAVSLLILPQSVMAERGGPALGSDIFSPAHPLNPLGGNDNNNSNSEVRYDYYSGHKPKHNKHVDFWDWIIYTRETWEWQDSDTELDFDSWRKLSSEEQEKVRRIKKEEPKISINNEISPNDSIRQNELLIKQIKLLEEKIKLLEEQIELLKRK